MRVSIGVNKNLICVLIIEGDRVLVDERMSAPVDGGKFSGSLYGLRFAAGVLRGYMERTGSSGVEVTFEIKSRIVCDWIHERKCPDGYAELFLDVLTALDRLRVLYSVVATEYPVARLYLSDGVAAEYEGFSVERRDDNDGGSETVESYKRNITHGESEGDYDGSSLVDYLGLGEE